MWIGIGQIKEKNHVNNSITPGPIDPQLDLLQINRLVRKNLKDYDRIIYYFRSRIHLYVVRAHQTRKILITNMNTELLGILATYLLTLVIAIPLGKYLAKVFAGERVWTDFLKPLEIGIFKISGINPKEEMNWKQAMKAMLTVNLVWLVYGFFVLIYQDKLPLEFLLCVIHWP